ncbi:MAG: WGR domain-containing protein [Planctomycetales bacterium]
MKAPSIATSPPARPQYFEFIEGKSAKFWEITLSGVGVAVRYGRIGTQGQTQTKSFGDVAAAQAHVAKLIAEKTEKGYESRTRPQ